MSNYTNHKIRQRIYLKEYIDVETGEILEEEEFKKEYTKIRTENIKSYGKNYAKTVSRKYGRKYGEQQQLF